MSDCIFCRIAAKEIPSKVVYEDDVIFAFDDIRPQAPVHTLIIPKAHIASLNDMPDDRTDVIGHIFAKAPEIAAAKGIKATGYRLVLNTGPDSGQDVFHVHFHILGGRKMHWPPG
ncbi:MAG: histidine triad nucleotide-binding protein [Candidatus Aminicenantes bacterium]|nr:histidine triad nucleotide-binding protein [Candidatus Aminicenantes bacterium]